MSFHPSLRSLPLHLNSIPHYKIAVLLTCPGLEFYILESTMKWNYKNNSEWWPGQTQINFKVCFLGSSTSLLKYIAPTILNAQCQYLNEKQRASRSTSWISLSQKKDIIHSESFSLFAYIKSPVTGFHIPLTSVCVGVCVYSTKRCPFVISLRNWN